MNEIVTDEQQFSKLLLKTLTTIEVFLILLRQDSSIFK